MKLSTLVTAGAALAGAASIATSASAVATVYENYSYSSFGVDGATLYVTNNDAFSYHDVQINGTDLGSLAAGASTGTVYIGDPCESVSCYATITINGKSSSIYTPDYDYNESGSNIGTITVGVPEPATWALMLVGVGGLGAIIRRRKVLTAATA